MPSSRAFCQRHLADLCLAVYVAAVTVGAFTGGVWATLGIGLATLLYCGVWFVDKKAPPVPKKFMLFACAVLALFAEELLVSSNLAVSYKVWAQLASIFTTLIVLTSPRLQSAADKPSFVPIVALAAGVGACALGGELLSGGFLIHLLKKPTASLTEYNRGIAHLVILAFPLFAGLWAAGKKDAVAALALALLFPACLTESHTAKLALIVGVICTAAAFCRPLWVQRGLAVAAVVLMGWPFYARYSFSAFYEGIEKLPPSWRHRAEIWDYLSYRIAERPFFGWGLGTTHMLDFTQPHGNLYKYAVQAAPHAHNFITEIWVETGVVGLAFGLVFLILTLRNAGNLSASLRPFALGGWAAAVTVSMFGFDFWTDALWAAFALSAFIFGILQQRQERVPNLVNA